MGDSKMVSANNWSALSTVTSIDMGNDIIFTNKQIYKPCSKSIFIESLIDQLCKLLEKDPHRRREIYNGICTKLFEMKLIDQTYQLEELASLRGHYQQAMLNFLRTPDSHMYKFTSYNLESSRYSNEYEEISFIAGGGFGKVYKAKHHLDQVIYAVKKISVKFHNLPVLIMESNEVKTLAKLNHPNIVQYKAAWLEPVFNNSFALPDPEVSEQASSDSDGIIFENSSSSKSKNENSSSEHNDNDNNLALFKYSNCDIHKTKPKIHAILYLSMQLCDETLKGWLDKRNALNQPVNLPLCIDIMIQAVMGIEYIHSFNIVHHDIKPSNIFLSNNLKTVQVGDFGLSCTLQGHTHSGCPLEGGKYGTPLYAPPEQEQCSLKSDMYSLGLLFIELLSVFSTEMERVSVLTRSRSGDLPGTLPEKIVPIVKKLISLNLEERPTSSQLLEMLRQLISRRETKDTLSVTQTQIVSFDEKQKVDSTSQTVDVMQLYLKCDVDKILKKKDAEITELRLTLARKDDEIAQLKKIISNRH